MLGWPMKYCHIHPVETIMAGVVQCAMPLDTRFEFWKRVCLIMGEAAASSEREHDNSSSSISLIACCFSCVFFKKAFYLFHNFDHPKLWLKEDGGH